MATEYTLLIQKYKDDQEVGKTVSSLDQFGFAVCDCEWPGIEIKEPFTRKWPGEHGEDVYFPPQGLLFSAFDLKVGFCYKGKPGSAVKQFDSFVTFLTGQDNEGACLGIYDPRWQRGNKNVYVKNIGNIKPHKTNEEEVIYMEVTFRVTNPKDSISL